MDSGDQEAGARVKVVYYYDVESVRSRPHRSRTQSDHSADPLTYIAIIADPGVAWLFCKISLSVRRVDQTCVQPDSLVQSLHHLMI